MADLDQTQALQQSLKDLSLRMAANFDEMSEALRHASKACKAFAADFEAAFPKAHSSKTYIVTIDGKMPGTEEVVREVIDHANQTLP